MFEFLAGLSTLQLGALGLGVFMLLRIFNISLFSGSGASSTLTTQAASNVLSDIPKVVNTAPIVSVDTDKFIDTIVKYKQLRDAVDVQKLVSARKKLDEMFPLLNMVSNNEGQ